MVSNIGKKIKKNLKKMISSRFKKNILVISTARSDFGLMKNIIYGLQKIKKFNTKLLVTGNHLLKSYGNTQKEIKKYLKKMLYLLKQSI